MKKTFYSLLVVGLALWPAEGAAQSASAGDRATLEALVREVRLLRQTVERQTATAVRSQLLGSRLVVQGQRVARAQAAADGFAEALEAAIGRQDQLRETLAKLNADLAPLLQDLRRSEVERQVADVKAELASQDREVSRIRTRRSQADQVLATEQRAYSDLESSLSILERQLQPAP